MSGSLRRARSRSSRSPPRSRVTASAASCNADAEHSLIGCEVYKSIAVIIMLAVHGVHRVPNACAHADCGWTQPLWWFEGMGGVFFLIAGLKQTLATSAQLDSGKSPSNVLYAQCLRAAAMLAGSVVLGGVESAVHAAAPWPEYLGRSSGDDRDWLQVAAHEMAGQGHAILSAHAGCQVVAALVLTALRGVRATRRPSALLVAALLLLVARTPAQRVADHLACCVPDRGLGAVDRCVTTPAASTRHAAPFRLPSQCVLLRGDLALLPLDPADFHPCGFGRHGPQYLVPCSQLEDATKGGGGSELGPPCADPPPRVEHECASSGPVRCDGRFAHCPSEGVLSCAWLAAAGRCALPLDELAGGTNGSRVASACPLECTPSLCANSPLMQLMHPPQSSAALGVSSTRAAGREAEGAAAECALRLAGRCGMLNAGTTHTHNTALAHAHTRPDATSHPSGNRKSPSQPWHEHLALP